MCVRCVFFSCHSSKTLDSHKDDNPELTGCTETNAGLVKWKIISTLRVTKIGAGNI
jgi:hypothetical protein